jgi:1-acyl-sn-glycerol-3-phosphate acyltransferase
MQGVAVLLLRVPIRFCFRCDVRMARLPQAPVVLAANHRSYFDPPFVGMWLREPVSYFARANLWHTALFRWLLTIMQGIPVERDNPGLSSMKGAIERLRSGVSVVAFPEGTRTRDGTLGRLRDGPAMFARRAGVPLVPVYVHCSERVWPRGAILPRLCGGRIAIRYGRAIRAPAGMDSRLADRVVTEAVSRWLQRQERALQARSALSRRRKLGCGPSATAAFRACGASGAGIPSPAHG